MTDILELPPPGMASYADLEALPERYTGELIAGTLYARALGPVGTLRPFA